MLNAPKHDSALASFIGLAGYMAYVRERGGGGLWHDPRIFSTVLSVVCELLARKMRTPATIFLLSALVPLVPGYNFYLAMLALVENRGAAAAQEGMVAVQIVAAIAVGAAVTSVIFRALAQRGKREANSPNAAQIGKPREPDGSAGKRQE
ncbi:MAG: threonine/serine exporter family protein [Christensenellales bacterium]